MAVTWKYFEGGEAWLPWTSAEPQTDLYAFLNGLGGVQTSSSLYANLVCETKASGRLCIAAIRVLICMEFLA